MSLQLPCDVVAAKADRIARSAESTNRAIFGWQAKTAGDMGWQFEWATFYAKWIAYDSDVVPSCSVANPFAPNTGQIARDLHMYMDELRQWQEQAQKKGIVIPGGVFPDPNPPGPGGGVDWTSVLMGGGLFVLLAAGAWYAYNRFAR